MNLTNLRKATLRDLDVDDPAISGIEDVIKLDPIMSNLLATHENCRRFTVCKSAVFVEQ